MQTRESMARSAGGKRDNPTYGQLNANLTKATLRKIKLYCTALDITISDATQEAFAMWLESKKEAVSEAIDE